jgi:hypothetical protein
MEKEQRELYPKLFQSLRSVPMEEGHIRLNSFLFGISEKKKKETIKEREKERQQSERDKPATEC